MFWKQTKLGFGMQVDLFEHLNDSYQLYNH